jgi:hypothetical protein
MSEASARLEEARTGSAIVAALRLAAAGPRAAAMAWIGLAVVLAAWEFAARAMGLPTDSEKAGTWGFWAHEATADAFATIASAIGLHAILRGRAADLRRPGVLAFVALMFLMELFWSAASALLFGLPTITVEATAGKLLVLTAAGSVAAFFFTRLLLWPVGLLLGRAELTPRRSWARMRGWTAVYIGSWLGLFAPVLVMALGAYSLVERFAGQDSPAEDVSDVIFGALLTALLTALSAVTYERRMGAASESLAEVFD